MDTRAKLAAHSVQSRQTAIERSAAVVSLYSLEIFLRGGTGETTLSITPRCCAPCSEIYKNEQCS